MMKAMLIGLTLFSASLAFAATNDDGTNDGKPETSISAADAKDNKNKVPGNIDEEITNANLRAQSGSRSRYSLATTYGWAGGSISNAFGAERPNLSGEPGQSTTSSIGIGTSARYRWTMHDSIGLGTSFGLLSPFEGHVSGEGNQFNVFDPSFSYSRVGKIGQVQTVAIVSYAYGTSSASEAAFITHEFGGAFNCMRVFHNGFSAGLSIGTDYTFFGTSPGSDVGNKTVYEANYYGNDKRTQWDLGLFPLGEYKFNDTYSFRTVFGYFNWKHLYGDPDHFRMLQKYVYQSMGVAISVTRDIYFYPYIQVVPSNLRSDFTNVALSATINIF